MTFKDVKVYYCQYMEQWHKYSEKIMKCNYIGFDVEYVQQKPAVLQLSTMTEAYVLHIFHYKELPKTLIEFLENEEKIKIGVGVKDDMKALNTQYNIDCKGGLDIAWTAYLIGAVSAYRSIDFLGQKILGESKLESYSMWGIGRLEKKQIDYAAKDAWIGIAVAEKIYNDSLTKKEKRRSSLDDWMKQMSESKIEVDDFGDDEVTDVDEARKKYTIVDDGEDINKELSAIRKTKEYMNQLKKEEKAMLKQLKKSWKEKKPKKEENDSDKKHLEKKKKEKELKKEVKENKKEKGDKNEKKMEEDDLVLNIFFDD